VKRIKEKEREREREREIVILCVWSYSALKLESVDSARNQLEAKAA